MMFPMQCHEPEEDLDEVKPTDVDYVEEDEDAVADAEEDEEDEDEPTGPTR